ncbi:hypothetical protein [Xylanivirga thermophila]|uniref:hypothetical protein n=1 Tax=Xylanivirga thermophila TaxID=2496273 RepID=UPI00101D4FB1|nr:hypothetical protein [Xylanivirga thermophila]
MTTEKYTIIAIVFLIALLAFPVTSNAGGVENSKVVVGINKLLEDIGRALITISIPAGTVVTTYCFIRRGAADEMDYKKWTNRIQVAIVSTIGAIVAGVIVTVISSYFK